MSNDPFLGLTMPVFTAFGWAGEEQALNYALGQLEQFIQQLYLHMPREAQMLFPHRGLDRENQGVFLAHDLITDQGAYITFHARPMALRMVVHLQDRTALVKALAAIQANHAVWHETLQEMGDTWELRLQQMEYNPETQEAVHYKDVFKDRVTALALDSSVEMIDRMIYLNGEEKWLGVIELSKRMNSEFVAAMGTSIVDELSKEIEVMLPVLRLLNGGLKTGARKKTSKRRSTAKAKSTATTQVEEALQEGFTYTATLRPMHLRKGFVNMTEQHWPFFKINSRTSTRDVVLKYNDGHVDRGCTVWRLMPSEKARLTLSGRVHDWMADNCRPDDQVQLTVTKSSKEPKEKDKTIEIELTLVN